MRIRFLSDLHLEHGVPDAPLPSCGEDLVVLAGDIEVGTHGVQWAIQTITHCPVVYVAGNHEFYGEHFDSLIPELKAAAAGTQVHVLEHDAFLVSGFRILGCTLWTDFDLFGPDQRDASMEEAQDRMNDFHLIRRGPNGLHRRLRAIDTRVRHQESLRWLQREIDASAEPVVVVTHHAPCRNTSHPRYAGDRLGPAFASDLESMMQPPIAAWIFGHTHHCCNRVINGVRIVSNQRCYPRESTAGFAWDRCIEIPDQVSGGSP